MLLVDTASYPILKIPPTIRKYADETPTKQEVFWSWARRAGKTYNYTYNPANDTWTNTTIQLPTYPKKPFDNNNYHYKTHKKYNIGWGKIISYLFKFGILLFFLNRFSEAGGNNALFLIPFGWWMLFAILIISNILIFKDEFLKVQTSEEQIIIPKNEEELIEERNRVLKEKSEFDRTYKRFNKQIQEDKEYVTSCLVEEKEILMREKYTGALKTKCMPDRNPTPVIRGKLELDFLRFLHSQFQGQILCDQRIKVGSEYFYPDFVLYDQYNKLHIDIEVDEPYSLSNKKPIHYQNSRDNLRDKYFLQNNWAIIRFSEKQIAKYPVECVKLVYDFRKAILNKESNIKINFPQESIWSYEQALLWAKENYRNTYMGKV